MKILKFLGLSLFLLLLLLIAWAAYIFLTLDIKNTGLKDIPAASYVGIKRVEVPMKDYPEAMSQAFMELTDYKENLEENALGTAFSMYEKTNPAAKDYDLVMAYELLDKDFPNLNDENIYIGQRPELKKAITFEYIGDYNELFYVWMYAMLQLSIKGYQPDETFPSMERYDISYEQTENRDNFKTTIIIPVVKR